MNLKELLIEHVGSENGTFVATDRESLTGFTDALSEILADPEGLETMVIEHLWQGCRHLQDCLIDGTLDDESLTEAYKKIHYALELLSANNKETSNETTQEVEELQDYTIPPDDIELIEDFITEGTEHLEAAEGAMLDLETNAENSDVLNLIFRSFHTIKGMAGFMNLAQIGQLTHNAETLLDLARKGEKRLTGINADVVFKTIDMLKEMLDTLRSAVERDGVVPSHAGVRELSDLLQQCVDGTAAEIHPKPPQTSSNQELIAPEETSSEEPALPISTVNTNSSTSAASTRAHHGQMEDSIKVKTSRLDNLINMIGELVIAQLMVSESLKNSGLMDGQNDDDKLERDIIRQGKLIRDLQELSTSMRMVPINGIFQKMARMTRDLARQAGKEIEFSTEGEQTELDRTIVDKLADPLVHMIRNAVDHGIENGATRLVAGKPEQGHITLKAYHAAGNILIEIIDDGKGLDKEKLFDKGVRMGMFQRESSPSEAEIFGIIFTPGLSTAETITKVSGRGVGMDVVKRNIENLRGRIDIESIQGKGTTFIITLPLTLAIIDGQLVKVGNEQFIVPINVIRKSFRPSKQDIHTVQGRGEVVSDRNELLPLVRLHELFDVEPRAINPEDGLVMVVEQDNFACGMLVDDLLDQQQVVIKNLGGILRNTPGISGGAIMGNGLVSLILDISGIIKISHG